MQNRREFLSQVAAAGMLPLVPSALQSEVTDQTSARMKKLGRQNKIGFNMLLWSASVSESMNPMVDRLKKIGYDGVEVAMGQQQTRAYVEFGKFLRVLGMEVNTVLALSPEADPIHESAEVRKKAVQKLQWAIDRSHDLGAKNICGPFHSAFAHFRKRAPTEDEYKRSGEVLHQAGDYAAKAGIMLTPEAINRFECYLCNTMQQLSKVVKYADHPQVKPMFDTHHANIEEKAFKPVIESLKDDLRHVHISENDRGTPGAGHVPWDTVFASLNEIEYEGWLTIEAFSRSDETFANSINVWREYNEPWDIASNGYTFIRKMLEKHSS